MTTAGEDNCPFLNYDGEFVCLITGERMTEDCDPETCEDKKAYDKYRAETHD